MDQLTKVKQIMEHDTRRAVNADSVKKGSVYGREYYSVSQTQKDNAFIDKVLQEKNRLLTVQSRNSSHLLVNDYKLMSFDGGKMKSVKENLFLLERALASKEVNEKVIKDVLS